VVLAPGVPFGAAANSTASELLDFSGANDPLEDDVIIVDVPIHQAPFDSTYALASEKRDTSKAVNAGCMDVQSLPLRSAGNTFTPLAAVFKKLGYQWQNPDVNNVPESVKKTIISGVLKRPIHGDLVPLESSGFQYWNYEAKPGYYGTDQAVYFVQVLRQQYKVVVKYVVQETVYDVPADNACKKLFPRLPLAVGDVSPVLSTSLELLQWLRSAELSALLSVQ